MKMESNQKKVSESSRTNSELKTSLSGRLTGSFRHRLVIVFLSVLIYLVSFINISNFYGKGGPTAAFFPVVVVGWLFGFLPGLFAGLLAFPVNLLTGFLLGASLSEQVDGGGISGIVVIMLMGMVVGRYRDLTLRLKKELTERQRAESDLTESKEQLDKLIDTSLDPIVITDKNSVIVRPNRAFLEMVEYDQKEVLGCSIYDLGVKTEGSYEATTGETIKITRQYFETDLPSVREKLYRDGKISNWQTYFLSKSGKIIPVTQNIVFSYNENNECISKFAIIQNVTEQRKAELELVASKEAAVEANNFRSRFFTNITHEFRTPLTLATGPVEGILRGEFGEISLEMRHQLGGVLKSSRQLLRLVNQLLDFSMLEAGAENVILENKDIAQFVAAVMDSFSFAAKKKNIQLDFSAAENMPVFAVDSGKLEKVLYNLVGNAFKYTPKGGTISVAVTDEESVGLDPEETLVAAVDEEMVPENRYLKISICDTGVGIKKNNHNKVFDRFWQAGESFALDQGGSGIGLAYSRELVKLMGGHIGLKSAPGSGSTFSLYLLQVEADSRAEESGSELNFYPEVDMVDIFEQDTIQADCISGDKPLVLVVDDNPDVRGYVISIVRKDYDFISAAQGKEGLALLEKYRPDLILCDIMMPVMDGYEFLRRVRANQELKSTPFIFLTAKADSDMKIAGLEEGADEYLVKPFNSLELLARMKSLLRIRQLVVETSDQRRKISQLTRSLKGRYSYGSIIGVSPAMQKIYDLLESIRESDASVLISGETGTGKELVASAIHYNSSYKDGPMISVNCGAIPAELMEREFFGHVKGAYTGATSGGTGYFQEADGGTLFLDEIGDMDLDMQVKLLRVLERGEVVRVGGTVPDKISVRIVSATNKDLTAAVEAETFRKDLYYRIHVIPIHLPSLRERREDIKLLMDHFLKELSEKKKITVPPITEKDLALFLNYDYPGNVRELQHILERFCILGGNTEELFAAQPRILRENVGLDMDSFLADSDPLQTLRARVEKDLILRALDQSGHNHTQAALQLNISRATLYKKIKKLGL
jgi:PAS domain S-box-containing protein